MKKAVVICSHPNHMTTWLRDCLASSGELPIDVYFNDDEHNHFEPGALTYAAGKYEEFWLIPDTTIIKDPTEVQRTLDDTGMAYSAGPFYLSFIGKYRKAIIDKIGLPTLPESKRDAVLRWEMNFNRQYCDNEPNRVQMDATFTDGGNFEEKHGRNNMILESATFKKYKGTWDLGMING